MSLTQHPDKNKDSNATEVFQQFSKAYEVLDNNETRILFDYYLDHPTVPACVFDLLRLVFIKRKLFLMCFFCFKKYIQDYFKVSGHHYLKKLPKADVTIIFLVVLAIVSWFFHVVQYQKWERLHKYLTTATLNKTSIREGGSKQTLMLHDAAVEAYEVKVAASGEKVGKKGKMMADPLFKQCVDEVKLKKIKTNINKIDIFEC